MRKLVLAALLATAAATSAQAAVVITFAGTTEQAPENSDAATQTIAGTITIDTARLPANGGTAQDTSYESGVSFGTAPFFTVSFTSSGVAPVLVSELADTSAYNDSRPAPFSTGGNYTFAGSTADGATVSVFQLFSEAPTASTIAYGGAPLPLLTLASGLRFSLDTAGAATYHAQGTITAIRYAEVAPVPEPASWTLMIGGFGLVGGVMRRRRVAAAAAA